MPLISSTVAEVMRTGQKDDETLRDTLLPIIQRAADAASEFISVFIVDPTGPNASKWRDFVFSIESNTNLMAEIIYYYLTTGAGLQTIGEEYVGIVQVDSTMRRHPAPLLRLAMVSLHCFTPIIIARVIRILKVHVANSAWIAESKRRLLTAVLNWADRITQWIYKLHRSLFFLGLRNDTIAKLLSSISYVSMRRVPLPEYRWFSLIGYLGVMQCLLALYQGLRRLLLRVRESRRTRKHQELSSPTRKQAAEHVIHKCALCLEGYKAISCSPCGHLFCWSCIYTWCSKQPCCPVCREKCGPRDVVRLVNYAL